MCVCVSPRTQYVLHYCIAHIATDCRCSIQNTHLNVLSRSDAIIRIEIWSFVVAVVAAHHLMLYVVFMQNVFTCRWSLPPHRGCRSIVVERFENIKITLPQIGAQKSKLASDVRRDQEKENFYFGSSSTRFLPCRPSLWR